VDKLEIIATVLGLVNIVLLVRRNIWNYPFGLAMVALYAHIFYREKLYSDALLQLFFFVIQLYGWWAWWRAGGGEHKVEVVRLTGPATADVTLANVYVTLVAQAECGSEPNGKYDAIVHDGSLSAAVWKK